MRRWRSRRQRDSCWSFLGTFVPLRCVLDEFDGLPISSINNCRYRHGKVVHLGPCASMLLLHEVHGSIWNRWLEGIGTVERKVIPSVTCPVIVSHEETLVDSPKNFGFYNLSL
jgi:hypothetical protein